MGGLRPNPENAAEWVDQHTIRDYFVGNKARRYKNPHKVLNTTIKKPQRDQGFFEGLDDDETPAGVQARFKRKRRIATGGGGEIYLYEYREPEDVDGRPGRTWPMSLKVGRTADGMAEEIGVLRVSWLLLG